MTEKLTSSERSFSSAGLTADKLRSCLTGKHEESLNTGWPQSHAPMLLNLILNRVYRNFEFCIGSCIAANGEHVEHL